MDGRCRVLYLTPKLTAGGAERVVVEHLRRLPRDRFAPELAVYDASGPYRARVPDDVPVHRISLGRWPSRLFGRVRSLRAIVDSRGIDIVSSHLPEASFLNLAEDVGRRGRIGRVVTVHADVRGIAQLGKSNRRRLSWSRFLRPRAHRMVFLCRETAEMVAPIYGARPGQAVVIPNGVDGAEIRALAGREPPPPWPSGGLRVMGLARLAEQKAFDILLRAFRIARDRGLDASLLIVGEGPERPKLERLRAELGLGDVVGLPGHMDNPYPALRHAELFVLSSHFEGFSLALLEALALGRPAITTACPAGPAELVAGGAGVLVPRNDPEALASAILDLGMSPRKREGLSERALARAGELEWSRAIDMTAQMLLEVDRERRRKA